MRIHALKGCRQVAVAGSARIRAAAPHEPQEKGRAAMDLRTQLGLALKRQRERRDLTQETLAEMANISVRHLAGMEAGTKNFTMKVLERLAIALDWDPLAELTMEKPPLREVGAKLRDIQAEVQTLIDRLKAEHTQFVDANRPKTH
jgi:transcriptional regulator with XRE-family HTH domain